MQIKLEQKFWCKCGKKIYPHKGIKNKAKHGKGKLHSFVVREIDYCCEQMEKAFVEKFIGFGDYEIGGYAGFDIYVNIYNCYLPYPECACWTGMEINFCPFCKKEIKISKNIWR